MKIEENQGHLANGAYFEVGTEGSRGEWQIPMVLWEKKSTQFRDVARGWSWGAVTPPLSKVRFVTAI